MRPFATHNPLLFVIVLIVALISGGGCRNGYHSSFFEFDFANKKVIKLTQDDFDNLNPVWSPDGTTIAFVSDRSENWDVWSMRADGTELKPLTTEISEDRFPAWSPDGKHIAFASNRSGNWDVWVMETDGSRPQQLTTHRMADLSPTWSRDGSKIAFVSYRDLEYSIYLMDADGQNQRKVTTGGNGDWGPSFSADGSRIAFVSTRTGNGDIWVIDSEGRGPYLRYTDDPKRDTMPVWSPDGNKIAFLSERGGTLDIWLMDRDGSHQIPLTHKISGKWQPRFNLNTELYQAIGYFALSWSPDEEKIAFTTVNKNGKGQITVLVLSSQS
ncbi:MAG: DPP IV N-terminal domain-containing protein [Nitrospira sp.]|nr:DPP IV N-terminal domain-containing protein [Nitrospira sp.]